MPTEGSKTETSPEIHNRLLKRKLEAGFVQPACYDGCIIQRATYYDNLFSFKVEFCILDFTTSIVA